MYKLEMKKTFTDEDRSKINDVISQFFEEFNPKSRIDLKNGNCHILVVFEQPPKDLIKKIMESNPDEFIYGESNTSDIVGEKQSDFKKSDESEEETETHREDLVESEEETETHLEDSDESEEETETHCEDLVESEEETETHLEDSDESEEETETHCEDSDESEEETETHSEDLVELEEETNFKTENAEAPIAPVAKTKKTGAQIKECKTKILLDFAAKAESFEEFINLIIKTIKFGKREEFFVKLVNSFAANQNESLAKISKELEISKNDYNSMGMQVSNYFKRNGEKISFGGFINEIVGYKDYSFNTENENLEIKMSDEPTGDEVSTEEDTSHSVEQKVTDSAEQAVIKNKVPVIPEFEEFLGNIDKTLALERRVEKVISFMDPKAEEKIYEHRLIRSYMCAGLSIKVVTHESIMKKDRYIPAEARMLTSRFIRNFINLKAEDSQPVLAVDFIEYLKEFILTSDELRKL